VSAPFSHRAFRPLAALALSVAASACDRGSSSARVDSIPPVPTPAASATAPQAPDSFRVKLTTSRGDIDIDVIRAWSPKGADRFYELVNNGYFTDVHFFRVVPGFVAQFGMHPDPKINSEWRERTILDDPVLQSNKRGTIVFATRGPNTRANQFFINFSDNTSLDRQGFSPFGRVANGMGVVDSLYAGYGESPDQTRIGAEGNAYLTKQFPKLDYIKAARVVAPTVTQ
jgi:cyclophilin family peptidyl-prolyl cis-trans isomerase